MNENTVKVNEIEEYEQPEIEVEEALEESSGSGAFVAGIVGGFLAYAAIGGVKKLVTLAQMKLAERKQKKERPKPTIEAESEDVADEQENFEFDEEAPENK